MNLNNEEQNIQQKVNHALDESVHQLAPETRERLSLARQQALKSAEKSKIWQTFLKPAPLTAALAFSFAIFIISPDFQENQVDTGFMASSQTLDDLVLLSELDDDTLELLDEIEFAYWLSDEMDSYNEADTLEEQTFHDAIEYSLKPFNIAQTKLETALSVGPKHG